MFHRNLELQYGDEMIQNVRRYKRLVVHGDEFPILVPFRDALKYFSASSLERNLRTPQSIPVHVDQQESDLTIATTSRHQ